MVSAVIRIRCKADSMQSYKRKTFLLIIKLHDRFPPMNGLGDLVQSPCPVANTKEDNFGEKVFKNIRLELGWCVGWWQQVRLRGFRETGPWICSNTDQSTPRRPQRSDVFDHGWFELYRDYSIRIRPVFPYSNCFLVNDSKCSVNQKGHVLLDWCCVICSSKIYWSFMTRTSSNTPNCLRVCEATSDVIFFEY